MEPSALSMPIDALTSPFAAPATASVPATASSMGSLHLALERWVDPAIFPRLPEGDDRLQAIANFFREMLIANQCTPGGNLEIEGRLGKYWPNSGLTPEEAGLSATLLSMDYLQLLPSRQEGSKVQKNLFTFRPGMREDHFYFLKGFFDDASMEQNPTVRAKPKQVLFDTFYKCGTRVSKNLATGEITESIEKVNRRNLEIRCRNAELDIRVSSAVEQKRKPVPLSGKEAVDYTRSKIRYSYEYEYMCFDLTKSKASNKGEAEYEVELEVTNVQYMMKYINDQTAFLKLVRRFIWNLQSLHHILILRYPEHFGNITKFFYENTYGKEAPKPLVGGYLSCMAYRRSLRERDAFAPKTGAEPGPHK